MPCWIARPPVCLVIASHTWLPAGPPVLVSMLSQTLPLCSLAALMPPLWPSRLLLRKVCMMGQRRVAVGVAHIADEI